MITFQNLYHILGVLTYFHGYVCSRYLDGFWNENVRTWVGHFSQNLNFWYMDGFWKADVQTWVGHFPKIREISVHGWVLSMNFRYMDGFDNKNWINLVTGWVLSKKIGTWIGLGNRIWYMDGWVGPTQNRAYVFAKIPTTPGWLGLMSLWKTQRKHLFFYCL